VPVIVTVNDPDVADEQDNSEFKLVPRTTLAGVKVQVKPAGAIDDVKATVPPKPLTEATVIVEFPSRPRFTVTLVGEAETAKSVTLNFTVAV